MPANPAGSDSGDEREALAFLIADQRNCTPGSNARSDAHCEPSDRDRMIADAILAAGYRRAQHDGERVAALEKERDAAWWLLEKHPQEIIGILKAERDALAAKLAEAERMLVHHREDWHKVSVRAEAAEAKLRKPTDGGTITAEDYWRERARADAAWTRGDEAESRAAALAEALREIERMPEGPRAGCLPQYTVQNIARAALAGNGTVAG